MLFKADGIIIFQSSSLNLNSSTSDVNLNLLLHISIRSHQNTIVSNSRTVNGHWGTEEHVTLQGKFSEPDATVTVTVYDHGDRYQILIDYHTVHYFTKRIKENVSYWVNANQPSPFSNQTAVNTFSSFVSGSRWLEKAFTMVLGYYVAPLLGYGRTYESVRKL